jgi:anti-sigma-K factor RskA
MKQDDDKLSSLLRQWRDIEPRANFEANVRRRIRLAADRAKESWLAGLLWRPALATAIAASVIIGVTGGMLSSSRQRAEMQFMSAGTLAGGYARLAR